MAKTPTKDLVEHNDRLPAGYDVEEMQRDAAADPKMTAKDVALPFVQVLQGLSPQCNPGKPEYIRGAQQGMFLLSVMDSVYDGTETGLVMIPCYYELRLVEWKDRDSGGGWVNDYPIGDPIAKQVRPDDKNKPKLPNGNTLYETAYHYCLVQDPDTGEWSQAVFPMKSTMLKKSRKWNNLVTTSKIPGTDHSAPRYLFAYQVKTELESKGENSWYVPDMTKIESPVELQLYHAARDFAKLVASGVIQRPREEPADRIDPETGEVL